MREYWVYRSSFAQMKQLVGGGGGGGGGDTGPTLALPLASGLDKLTQLWEKTENKHSTLSISSLHLQYPEYNFIKSITFLSIIIIRPTASLL